MNHEIIGSRFKSFALCINDRKFIHYARR